MTIDHMVRDAARSKFAPGLITLVVITATLTLGSSVADRLRIGIADRPSSGDFPPFVMTITQWHAERVSLADGRKLAGTSVYRLEYQDRRNWTLMLLSDEVPGHDSVQSPGQGNGCRGGASGYIETTGAFRPTSTDPRHCNGVGRWIHYGMAANYSWTKELSSTRVTYSSPGERVVFDRATGLPLLYEAARPGGEIGYRETYTLERFGPSAAATTPAAARLVASAHAGTVRWAIDGGDPDDPQRRARLVLLYEGRAESWRIVDQSGRTVLLVPVSGSGVAGTCATKHGGPGIPTTWSAVDSATLARFHQEWPTLRAISEGPLQIGARAELVDTGCRPTESPAAYFDAPPVTSYIWVRDGKPVSSRELSTRAGPAHCSWGSATFLSIGWPVGTVADTAAQSRQYIRDPRGAVAAALRDRLQLQARLPADARPLGYRYGPLEVFLSPTDQDDAIYLVGGGRVERWPRSEPMALCV